MQLALLRNARRLAAANSLVAEAKTWLDTRCLLDKETSLAVVAAHK